jgi:hypothetical protein
MDIEDALYISPGGQISVHDIIYGSGREIEVSGKDYYAHECGFTARSLTSVLERAGFNSIFVAERGDLFEVRALAFKTVPTPQQLSEFGLPAH